jgi:membrane-associated phospholipid phosphatase
MSSPSAAARITEAARLPEAAPHAAVPLYTPAVRLLLVGLALAIAVLTFASARTPYLPADVAITRALQSISPLSTSAANWITESANHPWCYVLLALSVVVACVIGGWRAAAVAIAVYFADKLFGDWLSPLVAQPRPPADLIHVVRHVSGYAFPSMSALIYVATFGYLGALAWDQAREPMRTIICVVAGLSLVAIAVSRIVLGAHWPSDLLASYLMGFFWIVLLLPFSRPRALSRDGRGRLWLRRDTA